MTILNVNTETTAVAKTVAQHKCHGMKVYDLLFILFAIHLLLFLSPGGTLASENVENGASSRSSLQPCFCADSEDAWCCVQDSAENSIISLIWGDIINIIHKYSNINIKIILKGFDQVGFIGLFWISI